MVNTTREKGSALTVHWSAPYHACGLGIEVLHDIRDAVLDVLQEALGNTGLGVQLRDAEVNAGQGRDRAEVKPP